MIPRDANGEPHHATHSIRSEARVARTTLVPVPSLNGPVDDSGDNARRRD
jgi:hypothetical protein